MNIRCLFISSLMLISASVLTSAQNSIIDRFSRTEGITTVYISESMLRMMPEMRIQSGMDLREFAGKLNGILIQTSENGSVSRMMKKEAGYFANDRAYEVLMKVKDGETDVDFFIRKRPYNRIGELVMLVDENNEFVLIQLNGNLTMEDIQKLATGFKK